MNIKFIWNFSTQRSYQLLCRVWFLQVYRSNMIKWSMIFCDGAVKSTKRCSAKKIPTLPELPLWQSSHVWVIHWEFQDKIRASSWNDHWKTPHISLTWNYKDPTLGIIWCDAPKNVVNTQHKISQNVKQSLNIWESFWVYHMAYTFSNCYKLW